MDEDELREIEKLLSKLTAGPIKVLKMSGVATVISNPFGLNNSDRILFVRSRSIIPALINEVRRLRAVLAEYADHKNWIRHVCYHDKVFDVWVADEHGYTRAENALREDGE